ncbi:SET and MYND domain-containing protein 5 [Blomia tropicalis]|nr:SET and MYND domain-containing protein 5 [Blomia tropicalis]
MAKKYKLGTESGSSYRLNGKPGLFATSSIYTGESILEERPLIGSQFIWNAEYKYDACQYCLQPLQTAEEVVQHLTGNVEQKLPYLQQCCTIDRSKHVTCDCGERYCSLECRQYAWDTYHQVLCTAANHQSGNNLKQSIKKLCEFWKNCHFPPETISIMLLVKLFAKIKLATNREELISKIQQFGKFSESYRDLIMNKLLGDRYLDKIIIIRDMVGQIIYELYFDQFLSDQSFVHFFALIVYHARAISTNSFTTWSENVERLVANDPSETNQVDLLIENLYKKMQDIHGPFINCEGSGLYELSSMINHSCQPNAEICFPFNNHVLAIKALEPIEPEQEITISYLDECLQLSSRHTRMKILQENFYLNCICPKCETQRNDPDVTSDEDNEESDAKPSDEEMNCD